jgi:tetratricopeptide (TPR) repeat protein
MAAEPINIGTRYVQRRVLLLSLVLLGILFVVTVAIARSYHAWESRFARQWIQTGNQDLKAGRASEAIVDFRNALNYGPEDNLVQLRLAEALLADGRLSEAHAYFLNLWERAPGSGEVNLDLAHISERSSDVDDAIRYYRSAIYGVWNAQPTEERKKVRLELCNYLLANGRIKDAQAEIAALAAEAPPGDASLHEQAGRLFMRVGSPSQAVVEFETALKIEPKNTEWWAEAGEAAFDRGNYPKAETYFSRASRNHPSAETKELLEIARAVLRNDPFQTGLSDAERARRTLGAFRQAASRLQGCLGPGGANPSGQLPLAGLGALSEDVTNVKDRVTMRSLRNQLDLQHNVMHLVFRIEEATAQQCGEPIGLDKALLLIGKQHMSSEQ